jgi:hypothetical protein
VADRDLSPADRLALGICYFQKARAVLAPLMRDEFGYLEKQLSQQWSRLFQDLRGYFHWLVNLHICRDYTVKKRRRHACNGQHKPRGRLSRETVLAMRAARKAGATFQEISRTHGVSIHCTYQVCRGSVYQWVTEPEETSCSAPV